ncbi:hypothetical protein HRV97_16955 [Sphingomonas sp. HHU CXW]|uniref:Uncharacterized protein n=1 Tax=Sphingomonas hominis TaxID=2741495 RepID=A0ABX2JJS9_9SPHN|nr:DUF6173 family protein [Sphingomonas hominis]NTS66831.1 hypothetical protein [Sphingomonas hominis]
MRTDPFKIPSLAMPRVEVPQLPKLDPIIPAKWAFERIARQIEKFETDLEPDEEIGLRLVATPDASVMHIDDVGYWGPDMLIFYGNNEHGKPMQLLQHYTQMSVLLTAVPAKEAEPRRIGFHLVQSIKDDAESEGGE